MENTLSIICPSCQHTWDIEAPAIPWRALPAGTRVTCPSCHAAIRVMVQSKDEHVSISFTLVGQNRTELTSEHDRDHRRYIVEWRVGNISRAPFVHINDLESGPYSNAASLTPGEALQLLAWLEQEKERLQEALLTEFRIDIQQGPGMA